MFTSLIPSYLILSRFSCTGRGACSLQMRRDELNWFATRQFSSFVSNVRDADDDDAATSRVSRDRRPLQHVSCRRRRQHAGWCGFGVSRSVVVGRVFRRQSSDRSSSSSTPACGARRPRRPTLADRARARGRTRRRRRRRRRPRGRERVGVDLTAVASRLAACGGLREPDGQRPTSR